MKELAQISRRETLETTPATAKKDQKEKLGKVVASESDAVVTEKRPRVRSHSDATELSRRIVGSLLEESGAALSAQGGTLSETRVKALLNEE